MRDYVADDELSKAFKYFIHSCDYKFASPTCSKGNVRISNDAKIKELDRRIGKIEALIYNRKAELIDDCMRRSREDVECKQSLGCFSVRWQWVPSNYYSLSLQNRAKILRAQSMHQLCKSMLMENRAAKAPNDCADRTNSRFYLVIVQYTAAINTKKLESEVRGLRSIESGNRLDPSAFDFRMAEECTNEHITGYQHNSVSPFGLLNKSVPVVVAKNVVDLEQKFIWMGGGNIHLKLGMATAEFVKGINAFVLDVSDRRETC